MYGQIVLRSKRVTFVCARLVIQSFQLLRLRNGKMVNLLFVQTRIVALAAQ